MMPRNRLAHIYTVNNHCLVLESVVHNYIPIPYPMLTILKGGRFQKHKFLIKEGISSGA